MDNGTFMGENAHGLQTAVELAQIAELYVVRKDKGATVAVSVTLGALGLVAIIYLIWLALKSYEDTYDN